MLNEISMKTKLKNAIIQWISQFEEAVNNIASSKSFPVRNLIILTQLG